MNAYIETVLLKGKDKITATIEMDLDGYKNTLITQINKKDENLMGRTNRLWKEIVLNSLDFDRKAKLLEAIEKITLSDINDLFKDVFIKNPKFLSIQVISIVK